ncbi:MAG: hypothetical protein AAGK17_02280 [Pseudomonadota bacterium]
MIKHAITATAFALIAAPLAAQTLKPDVTEAQVIGAVDAFFEALRSPDKTALATTMIPDGVIFVHDRRDPENPKIRIVPSGEHLKGWERTPLGTDEYMYHTSVLIDGTMAHVWGPYVFLVNGKRTHCGVNSMSLAKFPKEHSSGGGWKVTNTSFTMTALEECDDLGVPSSISTIPSPTPES